MATGTRFEQTAADALGWETLFECEVVKSSTKVVKVRVMRKGEDTTIDIREFSKKNADGAGYEGPMKRKGFRFSIDLLPALYQALGGAMESQGIG